MKLIEMKTLKVVVVSLLLLVMMATIVFIFWADEKNINGVFTGIAVALLAPAIGWWYTKRKYNSRKEEDSNN